MRKATFLILTAVMNGACGENNALGTVQADSPQEVEASDPTATVVLIVDNDNDGVASDIDCDDTNPRVHPFAVEICDDMDNDCDGQVDNVPTRVLYLDADGDGHGVATKTFQSGCDGAAFLVEQTGDCDDRDPLANQGAIEVCDGKDNDCDGLVDEEVLLVFHRDLDADGWGDALITTQACAPSDGWVQKAGDCVDNPELDGADINPDVAESCNGVDDNCDGRVDEFEPSVNLCADGDPYTVDLCDPDRGGCLHDELTVEFNCVLPEQLDRDEYACGSAFFFETAPGLFGREIVQAQGRLLTERVREICDRLAVGQILHVNAFVYEPTDPWYFWVGGEYTRVSSGTETVDGSPGTVTVFWTGLDFVYEAEDFARVCAP